MSNLQQLIVEKKNQISELKFERTERSKDEPQVVGYAQGIYRITRGNQVSDSRCENPFGAGGCGQLGGDYFQRQREKALIWRKQNIEPLNNQIRTLELELIGLEEKAKLPILRQQLITATSEYETLSPNDPEFRQKQIESRKSLYQKAAALDTLERKHNLFGNLPTRPQQEATTITPEPITVYKEPEIIEKSITTGTAEFDYKKLAIAGAGIFAVLALIIWRLK